MLCEARPYYLRRLGAIFIDKGWGKSRENATERSPTMSKVET
jgi:hypothetical protein